MDIVLEISKHCTDGWMDTYADSIVQTNGCMHACMSRDMDDSWRAEQRQICMDGWDEIQRHRDMKMFL